MQSGKDGKDDVELIPVYISKLDRDLGLKLHLVRRGIPRPPKAKRCKVCKELLTPSNKTELCDLHGNSGFKRR